MQDKKRKGIIGGALSLGAGAFISKLIGAIYRIPLTNFLGATGLGIYQMVFPVYTLLLDFSGAGVPSAISKIIASHKGENKLKYAREYLISGLKLLSVLGIIGTVLMMILAKPLSVLQGNEKAFPSYLSLAPAVFFVCVISCFRGYFQGLMDMTPTAVSQVVEQVVKLMFGLTFVGVFMPDVTLATAGATFAITLSEIVATIYFLILYKSRVKSRDKCLFDRSLFLPRAKTIIKTTIPIAIVGVMIPLSQVIDSMLIINLLSKYRPDATSLYGLFSGAVSTVINLPVAVCYGIATVAIPAISSAKDDRDNVSKVKKVLLLTVMVAVPCVILAIVFAPFIVNILFSRLSNADKNVTISLLRVCASNILLLSFLQTQNGVLIGRGKYYLPVISLSTGVVVKIISSVVLLKIPSLNIFGGAIGVIACYFVACLVNLFMIFSKKVNRASKEFKNRRKDCSE